MKNLSARQIRIIIVTLALSLVGLILFLENQSIKTTEKATFDQFNQQQFGLAKAATRGIELYFETIAGALRTLGEIPEIQQLDEAQTRQQLQYEFHKLQAAGINDLGVIDANGILHYNVTAPQLEGVNFSWREYFQYAKNLVANDTYIVDYIDFKGAEPGTKGVIVAVPIIKIDAKGKQPQFAGLVVGTIKLDAIAQRFVAPVKSADSGHAFLIDDESNILWSPDEMLVGRNLVEVSKDFPAFRQVMEKMGANTAGLSEITFYKFEESLNKFNRDETEEMLIAYAPLRLGEDVWSVAVWAPQEAARTIIRSAHLQQLFVIGLSIAILVLGSFHILAFSTRLNTSLEKEIEAKVDQLEETENKYQKLVDLSPDVIGIHTKDKIVFINKAGTELLGAKSQEQILEKPIWAFVPRDQRKDFKERYWQLLGAGQFVSSTEQELVRFDGKYVDVEITAIPCLYRGQPAMQAILRDISERKQAREKLEAAFAFQQSIIDGVAEPIMVIGADYRIKLMNRAAREFSFDAVVPSEPQFCYQVSHQQELPCLGTDHPCPMERVRRSGQPVTVVHRHYLANGQPRYVELIASPLFGPDGAFHGIIESIRDITDRKNVETMLVEQSPELAHSADDLEQFANKVVKSLQNFFREIPSDQ